MTTDLIKRLEEAAEGSRELDEAIALAAEPDSTVGFHCIGDDDPVWYRSRGPKVDLPYFTTSLDAAMTLAPDDHWLAINHRRDRSGKKGCVAGFDLPAPVYSAYGWAATFPLALCIAALKAKDQS